MQWPLILLTIVCFAFVFLCGWELASAKIRLELPQLKTWHIITGLIIISAFALFIRTYYAYPNVFHDGAVFFLETDAYYHMGAVDNILNNPHATPFLSLVQEELTAHRLMALLIAATAWITGLGSPSPYLIDTVGAVIPPIASIAVILMVYALTAKLFGKWVALISCAFVAVIPSEFLHRSLLGFTDQHVFEVLFSLGVIYSIVLAVSTTGKRQLAYFALGGIAIAACMYNWEGGLFMVLAVLLYWLIQTIYMVVNRRAYMQFTIGITVMCFTAFLLTLPFQPHKYWILYMFLVSLIPITITTIYYLYHRKKPVLATLLLLVIITPLVLASTSAIYLYVGARWGGWIPEEVYRYYNPSLLLWPLLMVGSFFTPDMLISEAQPLLFPNGVFSIDNAWANFQWLFFLQFGALGYLLAHYRMGLSHSALSFIVWFGLMFTATMCLRRYAYYLTIPTAVFGTLFLYELLRRIRVRKLPVYAVSSVVVLLFLWMAATPAVQVSKLNQGQITPDWRQSLTWLKEQRADGYITAWGDYGHWINCLSGGKAFYTPGATGEDVAEVMIYDGKDTSALLGNLGSEYLIIDRQMIGSKFHAAVTTCGLKQTDFYETYYFWLENGGKPELKTLQLFYPRYYESLAVRLFYYDREYQPPDVPVYFYEDTEIEGTQVKLITGVQRFSTVENALKVLGMSNIKGVIASEYPSYSPVPQHDIPGISVVYDTPTVKVAKTG